MKSDADLYPFLRYARGSPPRRSDARRDLKKTEKSETVGQTDIRNNGYIKINPRGRGIMQ
jgi:hypothetical protein